jgi:hypothetical protein
MKINYLSFTKTLFMEQTYHLPDFFYSPAYIISVIIISLLQIIAMWRVFEKAGKPGWGAIIPIYNYYLMLKIGGKPGWWLLLLIVPIANIVTAIWALNMISKSFGKDSGFTVGLLFLGFIFWPILGFGKSKYLGPYGDPKAFAEYQGKNKFDFEQPQ